MPIRAAARPGERQRIDERRRERLVHLIKRGEQVSSAFRRLSSVTTPIE